MATNGNFRLPPQLDLSDANLAESFRKWKQQLNVYLLASGATTKPKNVQAAIILHCGGNDVISAAEHFVYNDAEDKDDPDKVLKKLEEYCTPKQNVVVETFRFWKIKYQEPFDSFLTELRTKAESCKFTVNFLLIISNAC